MRIAFITAITERAPYLPYTLMIAPLGPIYVATYLESLLPDIEIRFFKDLSKLISYNPDVVGISSVTEDFNTAASIAGSVKENNKDIITIIGGSHITSLPESLPKKFDVGVIGEGEETFVDILKNLDDFTKVPGLALHGKDGKITKTTPRKLTDDIDKFPIPDRKRWLSTLGIPVIITSRGCPFRCSFCAVPVICNKYRPHSIERVIKEILGLYSGFNIEHILIADDLFTFDKKRLEKIANELEAGKINKKVSFSGWGRANLIDEEVIKHLKKMNFAYISFGLETGSDNLLKELKGAGSSAEKNQRAIDLCRNAGIKVGASFIFGTPSETLDDLKKTYDFIKKNEDELDSIELNLATPYPGTNLWNYALSKKMVGPHMDWDLMTSFEKVEHDKHIFLNERFKEPEYNNYFFKEIVGLISGLHNKGKSDELLSGVINPKLESYDYWE